MVLGAVQPKGSVQARVYRYVVCGREINYPEALYNDRRCEG